MNRRPKIYFGSQIAITPPTIIMMCNMPQGFPPSYRRYLLNVFREHCPFGEVPIKLYLQKRDSGEGGGSRPKSNVAGENDMDESIEDEFMDDDEDAIGEGEAFQDELLEEDRDSP
jgi:GTP-binding protein